jgi:hypothetical protein
METLQADGLSSVMTVRQHPRLPQLSKLVERHVRRFIRQLN